MKYKNKNKNKNKHKDRKWKDLEEIEDWTKVNEVFGEVYKSNRFWSLRVKTSNYEILGQEI